MFRNSKYTKVIAKYCASAGNALLCSRWSCLFDPTLIAEYQAKSSNRNYIDFYCFFISISLGYHCDCDGHKSNGNIGVNHCLALKLPRVGSFALVFQGELGWLR